MVLSHLLVFFCLPNAAALLPHQDATLQVPVPRPVAASLLPYQDATLPVPQRVTDLLGRMSLDELIGQTWHPESQPAALLTGFCKNGVGGTAIPADGSPLVNLRARNALQAACMAAQPHGIPLSFHQEGLHSGGVGGTVFPEPLLTACAWNETLATAIGAALAFEARGAGVDNVWSPVVNMWTVRFSLQISCATCAGAKRPFHFPLPRCSPPPPQYPLRRTTALGAFRRGFPRTPCSRRTLRARWWWACRAAPPPPTTTSRAAPT